MTEITIVQIENQLVVDSRIVAEQLGIEHKHFLRTIRNHKTTIEASFGVVSFQNSRDSAVFAYLTEAQSTFIMTLSRNTEKVIACKVGLVKAFDRQKKLLEHPTDRALFDDLANRVAKLEATFQHKVPPKAAVDPIPGAIAPLTERAACNRLVREYARNQSSSKPLNEQETWRWMYRELKYRHRYDVYARLKTSGRKNKLDQIEAEGYLPQLHAICNHFLAA